MTMLTVMGGGAKTNYTGAGSFLYESYPRVHGVNGWVGSAKEHIIPDPSTITVWAIGLRKSFLINKGMSVIVSNSTSLFKAKYPSQTYVIPDFHLTGVGAQVNGLQTVGNLLTANFPEDRQTVVAK